MLETPSRWKLVSIASVSRRGNKLTNEYINQKDSREEVVDDDHDVNIPTVITKFLFNWTPDTALVI